MSRHLQSSRIPQYGINNAMNNARISNFNYYGGRSNVYGRSALPGRVDPPQFKRIGIDPRPQLVAPPRGRLRRNWSPVLNQLRAPGYGPVQMLNNRSWNSFPAIQVFLQQNNNWNNTFGSIASREGLTQMSFDPGNISTLILRLYQQILQLWNDPNEQLNLFISLLPMLEQIIQILEANGGIGVGSQLVHDLIAIGMDLAPTAALLDQTFPTEILPALMICVDRVSGSDDYVLESFLRVVDGNGKAILLNLCDMAAAPPNGDALALRAGTLLSDIDVYSYARLLGWNVI
ncbi:hypothetical protein BDZ45DRAFT_395053 [Acephala macrosclerotiorum]|nr:hypothetical protein BDZ45DRAFT_395053 [Acephala macrosclerotiorum]